MESPKKVIVGCDLCDDFTQLCCYSHRAAEPVMIGLREEEESRIPTVLAYNKDTKKWLFGEDALTCAAAKTGVLVDHLVEKLQNGEEVELEGVKYSPIALLTEYLRKTMALVKSYFPSEPITKLVVTVADNEPALYDKIYEVLLALGLGRDRVWISSHSDCYLYYALSQEKSLWQNDIGLFDFSEKGLIFYQIRISRRTKPIIAKLFRTDYSNTLNFTIRNKYYDELSKRTACDGKLQEDMLQSSSNYFKSMIGISKSDSKTAGAAMRKTDSAKAAAGKISAGNMTNSVDLNPAYIFENIANTALYKQIVTTIYITGSGFEGGWAEDAIKSLCVGRRVFFGQNLYAKGACYAARELSGESSLHDVMLLGEDRVSTSVMMQVYCDAALKDLAVIEADERWYEVDKNIEVIAENGAQLNLILKNAMTRDIIQRSVLFEKLPERPDRMTRLRLQFTCTEQSVVMVNVMDLGFGDIYPGIGQLEEFMIEL